MTWCRNLIYLAAAIAGWCATTGTSTTCDMMVVAAAMSIAWVTWYGYEYRNKDQIILPGGLNVMPWIVWTLALLGVGLFYRALKSTRLSLMQRVLVTGIVWTVTVVFAEWIGYNVLNIKLSSNYPGLCGLKLMHGPWYLQLYYLTQWIIFLTLLKVW